MSQQEPKPQHSNHPMPPRERPLIGDMAREGKESDLWDLDHGTDQPGSETHSGAADGPVSKLPERNRVRSSPMIRRASEGALRQEKPQQKAAGQTGGIQINVRSKGGSGKSEMERAAAQKVESEFDDLDDWEEDLGHALHAKTDLLTASPVASEPMVEDVAPIQPGEDEANPVTEPVEEDVTVNPEATDETEMASDGDSGSEAKAREPLKLVERVGLVVLGMILVALASGAYYWSIHQLPQQNPDWGRVSFPANGKLLKVTGAQSYWRAPVLKGENADRVRRGTQLIPVVELDVAGGPAALRVRFRDHDRNLVGDTVTRAVSSAGKIVAAATVGFEDTGMHAAYRTGQLDPWTVEVFEADSVDAPGGGFSMIFEMKLSSELR